MKIQVLKRRSEWEFYAFLSYEGHLKITYVHPQALPIRAKSYISLFFQFRCGLELLRAAGVWSTGSLKLETEMLKHYNLKCELGDLGIPQT